MHIGKGKGLHVIYAMQLLVDRRGRQITHLSRLLAPSPPLKVRQFDRQVFITQHDPIQTQQKRGFDARLAISEIYVRTANPKIVIIPMLYLLHLVYVSRFENMEKVFFGQRSSYNSRYHVIIFLTIHDVVFISFPPPPPRKKKPPTPPLFQPPARSP